jgi:murein DD-endopeptidase MepM/ murein hydrolase activator NlpD
MAWSKTKKAGLALIAIMVIGLLIPQRFSMPVEGAGKSSYNAQSFWYYPWGKSVTHKGVDIFAKAGTNVFPSTGGLVVYCGQLSMGGNVVVVLGPKWRFHYYAHLQDIKTSTFSWAGPKKAIGTVGTSGNAAGKPPHLHYAIGTPLPYFWRIDKSHQGWKKMFYLNPIDYLKQ